MTAQSHERRISYSQDGVCFICSAPTAVSVNTMTPSGIMCGGCRRLVKQAGGNPHEGDTPALMAAHEKAARVAETLEAAEVELAFAVAAKEGMF